MANPSWPVSGCALTVPEARGLITRIQAAIDKAVSADDGSRIPPDVAVTPRAGVDRPTLVRALQSIVRNDTTRYEHHEARRWDGLTPEQAGEDGTRWLEPNEIARRLLRSIGEPVPDPFLDMKARRTKPDHGDPEGACPGCGNDPCDCDAPACGWCGDRPDPGMQFCSDDCAEKRKAARSSAVAPSALCEQVITVYPPDGHMEPPTTHRCVKPRGHDGKHATAHGGYLVEVPDGR